MSDDPEIPPPPSLSRAAKEQALEIADWCDAEADKSAALANRQFSMVGWLLAGGLVLVLILPRILQEIDYVWRENSLPPAIVATAKSIGISIDENRSEMKAEMDGAHDRLDATRTALASAREDLEDARSAVKRGSDRQLAMWRKASPEFDLVRLSRAVDGSIVGVARSSGEFESLYRVAEHRNGAFGIVDAPPLPTDFKSAGYFAAKLITVDRDIYVVQSAQPFELWAFDTSEPDGTWEKVWTPPVQDVRSGNFGAITQLSSGTFVASGWYYNGPAGSDREGNLDRQLLLTSADGLNWTSVEATVPDFLTPGGFWESAVRADGTLLIAGWEYLQPEKIPDPNSIETIGLDARHRPLLVTFDGTSWNKFYPTVQTLPLRSFVNLSETEDGKLLAIAQLRRDPVLRGRTNTILTSQDGVEWDPTGHETGRDSGLSADTDGDIWTFGEPKQEFDSRAILVYSSSDKSIQVEEIADLDGIGNEPEDHFRLVDGRTFLNTDEGSFVTLIETEKSDFLTSVLDNPTAPIDNGEMYFSGEMSDALAKLVDVRAKVAQLQQEEATQAEFFEATKASFDRQDKAVETFGPVTDGLEEALRTAEPARQLAQIATRLAVIALLVYLVQIVVNRYRYLQRLTGFYRARSQALRVLAAQPKGGFLKDVTLKDLTDLLSPDVVGFDKSAEPPTNQMLSLLQAGLKKT